MHHHMMPMPTVMVPGPRGPMMLPPPFGHVPGGQVVPGPNGMPIFIPYGGPPPPPGAPGMMMPHHPMQIMMHHPMAAMAAAGGGPPPGTPVVMDPQQLQQHMIQQQQQPSPNNNGGGVSSSAQQQQQQRPQHAVGAVKPVALSVGAKPFVPSFPAFRPLNPDNAIEASPLQNGSVKPASNANNSGVNNKNNNISATPALEGATSPLTPLESHHADNSAEGSHASNSEEA